MRKLFFIIFTISLSNISLSQNCKITLSGQILDKGTKIPLPFSSIFLEEKGTGIVSDENGFFQLEHLCADEYHVEISHVGCEPFHQFLTITKDTTIQILLNHHAELLDEIVVHGSHEDNSTQNSSSLSREKIEQNSNKNLSDILENITGVSTLKNGSGISKPVIHGLFGNRVAILNNGIAQSGQQWGNDHAPEIDPFVADHISVVKGAGALAYGGNSLGSVVLVETDNIQQDPHLHGSANYIFESNGFGNTLNTQLEKKGKWFDWRMTGSLKLQGDTKTPDYFLTNTGKREGNFALQLEKTVDEKFKHSFYFSSFNTEIGVLRGSHIGNLTDLDEAIGRDEPFFIKNDFSYKLESPRQKVNHHLLKLESKYFISEHQVFKFKYGGQLNDRKEFDIRRGGRSGIPALSLRQFSHFFEAVYNHEFAEHFLLKTGLQYNLVDNANDSETGISPLIPNYESHTNSAFLILQKEHRKAFFELGGRYDFKKLNVVTFTKTSPIEIIRPEHSFHNYAFSGGLKYEFTETFKTNLNAGYMLRSPEVNELYSSGLHQGVSGIEEGQVDLSQEKSLKLVASADLYVQKRLFIQALAYYQNIEDYIYLQPQDEFRLTIRGAFPVFLYEQTDARISGLDLMVSYEPKENLKWLFKYAKVNGKDLKNAETLINIPADNLFSSVTYCFKDNNKWKQSAISFNGKYVFQQADIQEEQDFLLPPDAYFLLGLRIGTTLQKEHSKFKFSIAVDNLLNTKYRDYLNRLRYFADDMGLNVSVNLGVSF